MTDYPDMPDLPWDNTEQFVREVVMRDGIKRQAKFRAPIVPIDDEVVAGVVEYLDEGAENAEPADIFFRQPEIYDEAVVLLYDFALYQKNKREQS
jgi:hypothetical protein